MKKLLSISLFLLLMVSWKSSAQIITSKKEAQKRGTYSYEEKEAETETASAAVTVNERKRKRRGGRTKTEPTPTSSSSLRNIIVNETEPDFIPAPDESYVAQQIINNAMEFEGVRYRTGGTTKDGMDCSGMVFTTFNIFDISLPRSSYEMAKAGKKIKLSEVKKGDLLFFDNNPRRRRINHVGLVVDVIDGEVKFLHASTQLGVIVSSLNEAYYDKSFVHATRVIEE